MLSNRTDRIKLISLIVFVVEVVVALIFRFVFKISYEFLVYIYLVIDLIDLICVFYVFEVEKKQRNVDISRVLGNEAKEAFAFGQIGIILYDENYDVTWTNEYCETIGLDIMGDKLTKRIPGIKTLFGGNSDRAIIEINNRKYEFVKSEADQVVFMKDVTELTDLKETYNNEKIVLGLISLDNYQDTIQNEDEQTIAQINTNIRQKVVEWTIGYGGVIRRLRSDKFVVIINEKNFKSMVDSRFAVLEEIKQQADQINVSITASMCFAYGSSNLDELDSTTNSLLELVLSRGGDQVAVKKIGNEVVYYGASSEASEKTSKVRARVMAQGLNGIIADSENVIIIPHNEADLDAFGSAIALSKIVQANGKQAYVIMRDINVEPKTKELFDAYISDLVKEHTFLSPSEALNILNEDTLVIVTDHHSLDLTSAPDVVNTAKRIAIIDHHRKKSDTNIAAMMIYNEPSSSSSVELVSELMQYQQSEIELTEREASIMYAGLLVDTDCLKSRCSARTFEVCAYLKKAGTNVTQVNDWLRDSLDDFMNKATITKYMEMLGDGMVVSAVTKNTAPFLTRTALSQGANYICGVKEVNAAFVVGHTDANTVAVSARSNGTVNVQLILEQLGGGGHFNAAGLQRTNTTVEEIKEELLQAIKNYQIQGGKENEGSTTN